MKLEPYKNSYTCKDFGKVIVVNNRNIQVPSELLEQKVYDTDSKQVYTLKQLFEFLKIEIEKTNKENVRIEKEALERYANIVSTLEVINEKIKVKGII